MGAPVKNEHGSTSVASRDAFGDALVRLGETHPELVVLEADLSESTRSKKFGKKFPDRFFQMGIAEARATKGKPTFILAETTKGKGVSFMEGKIGWHGVAPTQQQLEDAVRELRAAKAAFESTAGGN